MSGDYDHLIVVSRRHSLLSELIPLSSCTRSRRLEVSCTRFIHSCLRIQPLLRTPLAMHLDSLHGSLLASGGFRRASRLLLVLLIIVFFAPILWCNRKVTILSQLDYWPIM